MFAREITAGWSGLDMNSACLAALEGGHPRDASFQKGAMILSVGLEGGAIEVKRTGLRPILRPCFGFRVWMI